MSEPLSKLVIDPRITASHTRNRARGIAVPRTIAVLHNKTWIICGNYLKQAVEKFDL